MKKLLLIILIFTSLSSFSNSRNKHVWRDKPRLGELIMWTGVAVIAYPVFTKNEDQFNMNNPYTYIGVTIASFGVKININSEDRYKHANIKRIKFRFRK